MKAASEGLGAQSGLVGKDTRGSLVCLSVALLLMSRRASPTLYCFSESSSSQAAPLPDRGRAGLMGWDVGAEECYTPAHSCSLVGPTHSSLSVVSLLSCTAGSWGMETS